MGRKKEKEGNAVKRGNEEKYKKQITKLQEKEINNQNQHEVLKENTGELMVLEQEKASTELRVIKGVLPLTIQTGGRLL